PAHPGHHDVQNDQVRALPLHQREQLRPIGRGPYRVAAAGQRAAQPLEQERIVVRDEDLCGQFRHGAGITASAGRDREAAGKPTYWIIIRQVRRHDEESLSHAGGGASPPAASGRRREGIPGAGNAAVAAGEHDGGGPPARPEAAGAERGDGGRAGVLDERLGAGEEGVGGGGDRVVVDGDDVVDERAGVGEGAVAGSDGGEAVGDGGFRLDGDGPAGVEGAAHGAGVLGLDADDGAIGPVGADPGGGPGEQPAAADGDEDGADVGPVLEDLDRDGALARDDVGVVEGRDHGEAALGGDGLGAGLPLGGGGALEHDLGAQAAGALDLDVRGGDGHDDDGGDLEEPRGEGDGLCVVAGGKGDDAGPALLLGQARDHGVGAPQLEGADALEVLALEADLGAGLVRQPVGREERGPDGDAVERTRRGPDALRRDERAHSPISSPSEGAPPAGASSSASREGAAGSAALASPFSSSSGTSRATSTRTSPSSSAMMRTPWVARPITRISPQRTRFTTPLRVISISSSPFWTS